MTDMMTDMTDTGVTDMTADIEAMMTDLMTPMTDTGTDTDTMTGDKEHILVEGL